MKRNTKKQIKKILFSMVAFSVATVTIPTLIISCKRDTKIEVDKTIPTELYDIEGTQICGFSEQILDNPTLLDGYDTMKFADGASFSINAFANSDNSKYNACLSYIKHIDLSNVASIGYATFHQSSFTNLLDLNVEGLSITGACFFEDQMPNLEKLDIKNCSLGHAAFYKTYMPKLDQLNFMGVELGSVSFYESKFPGVKSLAFTFPYPSSIPVECFVGTTWYDFSPTEKLSIFLPATAIPNKEQWTSWADKNFGSWNYQFIIA